MALDHDKATADALAITERILASDGLEGFSARKVAREAGISVGTLYNLFGDTDTLIRQANIRLLDRLAIAGATALSEIAGGEMLDVRARLLKLAHVYAGFVEENRTAWGSLLAFNRAIAGRDTPDWYRARQETLFAIIADVLSETPLGRDREKLVTAARALWSSVHGIVTNAYRGVDDNRLDQSTWDQIDLLVTMFVRGVERA